ncbi:polyhydroxyalkanoate synthesis regulator DNA-binding domain-containing protein [Azotobacter vinelandii]
MRYTHVSQWPKRCSSDQKKYPNRRLYDTRTSSHITLADIRQLVVSEEPFQVIDAKTGEDLTRNILLQIIQEAESDGEPIFFQRNAQRDHSLLRPLPGRTHQLSGKKASKAS